MSVTTVFHPLSAPSFGDKVSCWTWSSSIQPAFVLSALNWMWLATSMSCPRNCSKTHVFLDSASDRVSQRCNGNEIRTAGLLEPGLAAEEITYTCQLQSWRQLCPSIYRCGCSALLNKLWLPFPLTQLWLSLLPLLVYEVCHSRRGGLKKRTGLPSSRGWECANPRSRCRWLLMRLSLLHVGTCSSLYHVLRVLCPILLRPPVTLNRGPALVASS